MSFPVAAVNGQEQAVDDAASVGLMSRLLENVSGYATQLQLIGTMEVDPPEAGRVARVPVVPGPALRAVNTAWVESTLASMTVDEKIGQMLMPAHTSNSTSADIIDDFHVGGFIFLGNSNTAPVVQTATNYLQCETSVPLIFSTDCEAGLGARFTDATRFPLNMGCGAAYDLELVRQQGRVTARECRAIGIQIGFGPVVDVNTEPVNPIIGVRAYGDKSTSAAELARAYVEGANAEGLLCTFKHFPGHGAAAGDSHLGLPRINISMDDLQNNHVSPYETLLADGIGDLVMTAHVWYPVLDPGSTAWPATLSVPALTNILRNQLSYDGCVISDAFGMAGLQQAAGTYDAVKLGVQAGLDIILMPPNMTEAFNGLKDRVISGEIPVARIDESVRRILALKSRVGMPESVTVPVEGLATVGHPDNTAVAEAIGRKTIAGDLDGTVLPVLPNESLGIFVLQGNSTIFYSYGYANFTNAMELEHPGNEVILVPTSPTESSRAAMLAMAAGFNKVLVVSMEWGPSVKRPAQVTFINEMLAADIPMAYLSFGGPYQWNQYPGLQNFLCGFSSHYATQQQMAKVIVGEAQADAHWPVELEQAGSNVAGWEMY